MVWFHAPASSAASPAPAPAPIPSPASAHTSTADERPPMIARWQHSDVGHLAVDYHDAVAHEGLGAMLAHGPAMDRAAARRELAPMFTVREADAPRDRLSDMPNTVTRTEFERLSRTYSDIRRGETHLDLVDDPSQPTARGEMMQDIANILQTRSGRELVEALAHPIRADGHPTHDTSINNYGKTDNSFACARGFFAGMPEPYVHGIGTNTEVHYMPGITGGVHGGDLHLRSDVALYHELAHAYHRTHGSLAHGTIDTRTRGVAPGDVGIDRSEAQATGLYDYADADISENRYRQERRQIAASGVGVREGIEMDAYVRSDGDASMPLRDHYTAR